MPIYYCVMMKKNKKMDGVVRGEGRRHQGTSHNMWPSCTARDPKRSRTISMRQETDARPSATLACTISRYTPTNKQLGLIH